MRPETYLEQYRITAADDGAPLEITRNGPAVTYRASDLKSGAPVALTLIPKASVDPAGREQFEEKARSAMLLDHVNIARTVAFGTTEDSFVFVSEYPQGETVESWVKANGPMPADAVLRIALQVVAAVGAASFHGLNHPAIQPANLVIVAGKTVEGGWPFIKLGHFALSGLKSAPGHTEPDVSASDFASPEQLLQGKIDFRSEIYSLGATMCFLLTGVFYSAYPRSPQTKRFARPLRTLIAHTLEDDPVDRPQDPVLFTEELRDCLAAIERRQALQRKFGIPFSPIVTKPRVTRRLRRRRPTPILAPIGPTTPVAEPVVARRRWHPAWVFVGVLLALGVIAALFMPEDIVTAALHRKKPIDAIGVPVGVPEKAASGVAQTTTAVPLVSASPAAGFMAAANTTPPIMSSARAAGQTPPPSVPVPPVTVAAVPTPAAAAMQTMPNETSPQNSQPAAVVSNERHDEPLAPGASLKPPSPDSPVSTAVARDNSHPSGAATPPLIASNNVPAEPAPPSESADESGSIESNQSGPGDAAANTTPDQETSANPPSLSGGRDAEGERPAERHAASSGAVASKSRNKRPTSVAQGKSRALKQRVPRALPAETNMEPDRGGTMRARVVGITPAGNVILALPSGEQAIVAPQDAEHYSRSQSSRRRPRRVIIERRTIVVPQYPPYQPFVPPDA